ncbi:hypothetical protein ATY79_19305 [Rhizobium sp. R693]|nr:hypothetical protein ATY79_19305 [Rhizobium sp. R693]
MTSLEVRPPFEQTNNGLRSKPAAARRFARFEMLSFITGLREASKAVADVLRYSPTVGFTSWDRL